LSVAAAAAESKNQTHDHLRHVHGCRSSRIPLASFFKGRVEAKAPFVLSVAAAAAESKDQTRDHLSHVHGCRSSQIPLAPFVKGVKRSLPPCG